MAKGQPRISTAVHKLFGVKAPLYSENPKEGFAFEDFIYLFLERGGREGEGRKRNINQLPLTRPSWWPDPQSRHVPLLGIDLGDLSLCRPALNPLSHTSQG